MSAPENARKKIISDAAEISCRSKQSAVARIAAMSTGRRTGNEITAKRAPRIADFAAIAERTVAPDESANPPPRMIVIKINGDGTSPSWKKTNAETMTASKTAKKQILKINLEKNTKAGGDESLRKREVPRSSSRVKECARPIIPANNMIIQRRIARSHAPRDVPADAMAEERVVLMANERTMNSERRSRNSTRRSLRINRNILRTEHYPPGAECRFIRVIGCDYDSFVRNYFLHEGEKRIFSRFV